MALSRRRSIPPAQLGLAATVGLAAVTSTLENGPILCGFRLCTGGYCPGCGGSRAAAALLVGDLGGAWQHHPWIVLIAAQIVVLATVRALVGRLPIPLQPVLYGNLVVGVGIWVLRLSTGAIPAPF